METNPSEVTKIRVALDFERILWCILVLFELERIKQKCWGATEFEQVSICFEQVENFAEYLFWNTNVFFEKQLQKS